MKFSVAVRCGAFSIFACGVSLALTPVVASGADSALTQAIAKLDADTLQVREIELRDLGITTPMILSAADSRRDLYLPIPANVPLTDATLTFEASYLNSDSGRNTLLLSLDGYPVVAQELNEARGNASATVGVDKAARDSGFVRLGIAWSAAASTASCEEAGSIGNVLRVDPRTRLSYSYDASQLHDIDAAWNALPGTPGILVAPGTLSPASYDATWRLGVALQRIGKHARILPFPSVHTTVDLSALRIPAELLTVPAFASLNGKDRHVLANTAEIGALLVLGQTPNLQADLAVSDPQLLKAINESLDALQQQIQSLDAPAAQAFVQWRTRHINAGMGATGSDNVRLALLGTRPVLSIVPEATVKALTLFNSAWSKLARNRQLTLSEAQLPVNTDGRVTLARLGGIPGTLEVLAKSEWSTAFALGSVAYDGRVPVKAIVDVSAAPGVSDTPPVVSVFLNEYLIGAEQLFANGQKQRIEAPIPYYALGSQNVLRVSFQRQPVSNGCQEVPQAFAVSVLPTSHIVLKEATLDDDFAGLSARFAVDTQLLVPQSYLDSPADSLPQLIQVISATGVSPLRAQLSVSAEPHALVTPNQAFLAFELPIKDGDESVQVDPQGRLSIRNQDQLLLDLQQPDQLDQLASLQVVTAGSQHGLVYRTLGARAPQFDRPIVLTRGTVTILGNHGPITTFDAKDPGGSKMIDKDEPKGLDAWREPSLLWLIPAVIVAYLVLLLAGRRARRNRQ
ncbi:cellulose biosynthesis cyclic di-GMP-binding regulatory protein BcsB [Pseudomonas fluorescens]|uniref:Uncharacterized protein n=1 Tax=Pseudomonas fluorescens TaxID=294 RepID=A0A5E7EVY0_PSEFL|nr:cellulose biosynthesis cyclic di-GMP-binding regulatory protein BcsB [Pseudomonas fluorescens]VVO31029.1 hypothetical protein PS723_04993 [Pseudomonas fluorescens]